MVAFEKSPSHVKVKAKSGDSSTKLLSRYKLLSEPCNVRSFLKLNNLKPNDFLLTGVTYQLPIKVYTYNSQSIRSTIGNNDWDLAKKIAKYNRFLRDQKLKKQYYLEDKVLYVPYHLLDCPEGPNNVKIQAVSNKSKSEKKELVKKEEVKKEEGEPFFGQHKAVTAQRGDGIISLLRRYELAKFDCNFSAFETINNLKKNDHLKVNQSYFLPVRVYSYNGRSIRSTIGIDDWDLAKRIAKYNRELRQQYNITSTYQSDQMLYVPYHLLNCPEPTLIAKAQTVASKKEIVDTEVFGVHRAVELVDKSLKNKVYYLLSGHGGPDPGAEGIYKGSKICEDEYAYDVTLRLARNLIAHGAQVHVIIQDKNDGIRDDEILLCDRDEVCIDGKPLPGNQFIRLQQRTHAVNRLHKKEKRSGKEHLVVAIHVDSRPKHKRQDVFFYHTPKSKDSEKWARKLHSKMTEKYKVHRANGNYEGTVSSRGLYVLRKTHPTAVFIELANIKNSVDQKRLTDVDNRQYLADWIYEGLTD